MARRGSTRARWRVLGAGLLLVLAGSAFGWWHLHHWQPDRVSFPVQGVEIGAGDGNVDWPALKAVRGRAPVDLALLEQIFVRFSELEVRHGAQGYP